MQDRVGPLGNRTVRNQVVALARRVSRIECVRGNELGDVDGFVVLRAELVEFVGIDDDVLPLRVLVAGNDLVIGNFAVNGASFLVIDAAVAFLMQLIQMDLTAAAGGGGVSLDRKGDETEFQKPLPTRTCSHSITS